MKKFLLLLSLFSVLFIVACTAPAGKQAEMPAAPAFDTAGLAAFQEWKFLNERKDAGDYMQEQAVAAAPVKKVVRKTSASKKPAAPRVTSPAPAESTDEGLGQVDGIGDEPTGTIGSEGTNEAKSEKKGISNAAKGTVIGAVSGAVLGAVINKKNRVVGGVIGGVLGGGVGYGIGRKMDKKEEEANN
jgi:hypothetical protein